jgi:hypothetical protein
MFPDSPLALMYLDGRISNMKERLAQLVAVNKVSVTIGKRKRTGTGIDALPAKTVAEKPSL